MASCQSQTSPNDGRRHAGRALRSAPGGTSARGTSRRSRQSAPSARCESGPGPKEKSVDAKDSEAWRRIASESRCGGSYSRSPQIPQRLACREDAEGSTAHCRPAQPRSRRTRLGSADDGRLSFSRPALPHQLVDGLPSTVCPASFAIAAFITRPMSLATWRQFRRSLRPLPVRPPRDRPRRQVGLEHRDLGGFLVGEVLPSAFGELLDRILALLDQRRRRPGAPSASSSSRPFSTVAVHHRGFEHPQRAQPWRGRACASRRRSRRCTSSTS